MYQLPIIGDHYDTPENKSQAWLHKIIPHFQIFFKLRFLKISFHARTLSVRGAFPTAQWIQSSYEVMKLLEDCGGRFHISGIENIRKSKGPLVFIGNHMSTLETMVLPYLISQVKDCTFVVKDTLVKSKFFAPIMKSRDPIVVSRHDSRADLLLVLTRGPEILASGRSIVIFPQSTRRLVFDPEQFNSLGVKLALKAGVPIIPFALKTDFWRNGKYVKDLGPLDTRNSDVYFSFGPVMEVIGTGKEGNHHIIEFIQGKLAAWEHPR